MTRLPVQIDQLIEHGGGLGLRGSFTYVGGKNFVYKTEYEGAWKNATEGPYGTIDYDVGLQFDVNGGNRRWKMVVSADSDDTYSVWLWRPLRSKDVIGEILDKSTGIYCENLKKEIESMYDRAVKKYMGGFIPC